MSGSIPFALRAAMRFEREVDRLRRWAGALTERYALTMVPDARRTAVTASIYSTQRRYAGSGDWFERGLLDYERDAVEAAGFRRGERLLLAGCGGGRELRALVEDGFAVNAFDVAPQLAAAAAAFAAQHDVAAIVRCGSFADLVAAVGGRANVLSPLVDAAPYDGIVLGWGSFPHVTDAAERAALFGALARLGPAAPVIFTYLATDPTCPDPMDGVRFAAHMGYYAMLAPEEIDSLAEAAGYRVAMRLDAPYPHAVFIPRDASVCEPTT